MTCVKSSVFANDRLRISVTDSCNLTCFYCTNEGQGHQRTKRFLALDWWSVFTERLRHERIYVRKLNITGGEPLLHPDLSSIIELAAGVAEHVSLNTNGILLSPERVRDLFRCGLHNIKFGVDWVFGGPSKPLLHARTVDTQRLLASITTAVDLMPRSSLNIVVTTFNADRIKDIAAFVLALGIDKVEFLELIAHDFRSGSGALAPSISARDIVETITADGGRIEYNERLAKYLCWTRDGSMIQVAEDFCVRRVCRNLWTRIDARGHLLPCIKGRDSYAIDLSQEVAPQIRAVQGVMCSGIDGSVPRSADGTLLPSGESGRYERVDLEPLREHGITLTRLDP